MYGFDENLIKITDCKILGELPDLFKLNDGTAVTRENWELRRKEIYKTAIELQYGTMPPEPEFLEVETICRGAVKEDYRIITGRRENPVQFIMTVFKAKGEKTPVVIDGDLCFKYPYDNEFISTFTDNGISLVLFNRTELAPDINNGRVGPLYRCYSEYTFGALGAWAWGYSRCVDAIKKLGFADMDCITFTGHSRGGKTAMLAGALDTRAAIVNPNATCAGSSSCYRVHLQAITEDGETLRSETLDDLWKNWSFWIGPQMQEYVGREEELPFDCHFLKAMIAPRVLLQTEAASDIWSNPVGALHSTNEAKKVFELLGVPDNILLNYRRGYHCHHIADIAQLVNVIKHYKYGEPLNEHYFKLPFKLD